LVYDEVEQTVPDYMSVLRAELAGESYHKTDHRNAWLNLLARRNGPAVEVEHCNISVVLQRRNSPALTVPTAKSHLLLWTQPAPEPGTHSTIAGEMEEAPVLAIPASLSGSGRNH
jgi:hypothetical protein